MAKRIAEQMELFEPVERGFNEGGDTSSAKDAAMQNLQSSAADKKTARKDQFDKLTDMLMSGEIKDMPEEKQQKFIKLYKMMKSQGFNEGGLMDEGGMVDEESGNEVPPGSLREEVRDDIPAQLSEGEFVFPADVVRYIGLENLMRMRQEAKQGLAEMEAMGQMGNSEEAIMPDDLPFDMYDLELEEEQREYNTGGYVAPQINPQTGVYQLPGTGITGYEPYQGSQTGYNPYGGATPYFQPVQFTGPQYTTAVQTTNLPTFGQTVGSDAVGEHTLYTCTNDAGQVRQIPHKNGKPIYPIPEGFVCRAPGEEQATQTDTTTVTPTTGQVRTAADEGGGRESVDPVSATGRVISLGGYRTGKKGGGGIPGFMGGKYAGPSEIIGGTTQYGVKQYGGKSPLSEGMGPLGAAIGKFQESLPYDQEGFGLVNSNGTEIFLTPEQFNALNASAESRMAADAPNVRSVASQADANVDIYGIPVKAGVAGIEERFADKAYGDDLFKDAARDRGFIDSLKGKGLGAEDFLPQDIEEIGRYARANDIDDLMEAIDKMSIEFGEGYEDDFDLATAGVTETQMVDSGLLDAAKAKGEEKKAEREAAIAKAAADKAAKEAREAAGYTAGTYREDSGGSGSVGGVGKSSDSDTGYGDMDDCLTEKMKVKLNGVIDFVTNIKVGDMIDGSVVKEVLHKHMRNGYFVINNELEITNDHPVWAKSGGLGKADWIRPEQLVVGDTINGVKVTSLNYIDRLTPTVSIVIDGDSFDVYTKGNTYTVHGRYREVRQQAA